MKLSGTIGGANASFSGYSAATSSWTSSFYNNNGTNSSAHIRGFFHFDSVILAHGKVQKTSNDVRYLTQVRCKRD